MKTGEVHAKLIGNMHLYQTQSVVTCVTMLHPVHVVDTIWLDYTMHQHANGIAKIMPKSQTKVTAMCGRTGQVTKEQRVRLLNKMCCPDKHSSAHNLLYLFQTRVAKWSSNYNHCHGNNEENTSIITAM